MGVIAAIVCLCLGLILTGPPNDPDTAMGSWVVPGVFLLFCYFMACLYGWGRYLQRKLEIQPESRALGLAFGGAFLSILGTMAAAAQLASPRLNGGWHLVLISGLLLHARGRMNSEKFLKVAWSSFGVSGLGSGLCLVGIGTALLYRWSAFGWAATKLRFHTDPLYYHLYAPRLWSQFGGWFFPSDNPMVLTASSWESLVLWPCVLLGGEGHRGLIEIHHFGQWLHWALGFVLSGVLLIEIFKVLKVPRATAWMAALASTYVFDLVWVAPLAKNDWGVASWALAGFLVWISGSGKFRLNLVAGLFFGLALIGKLSSAFWILPMLFIRTRIDLRVCGGLALGATFACAPFWIRNGLWIGNPFFPAATGWFKSSWISKTLLDYHHSYERGLLDPDFEKAGARLVTFLSKNIWVAGAFCPPRFSRAQSETHPKLRSWFSIWFWSILSLFFFSLENQEAETRLYGVGLLWISAFSVVRLHQWIRYRYPVGFFFVLICFLVPSPGGVPNTGPTMADVHAIREIHEGGMSRAWLRLNADPMDLILTTEDNMFYYLSALRTVRGIYSSRWEPILNGTSDPELLARSLERGGVRYVLQVLIDWGGEPIWTRENHIFDILARQYPEAVVFETKDSWILDLHRLEESAQQGCLPVAERF